MTTKLFRITAVLTALVFAAGLVLFALNGRYVRLWADDYTYSAVAREGLIDGTINWYYYNGARMSSFWLVGFIDLFGPQAVRFLPGLVLVLWVGGIWFALKSILDLARVKLEWIWPALSAVMLVFFSVLLMPTRLESLYWRMGMLHYTLPIPLTLFTLGLILKFADHPTSKIKMVLRGILILVATFFSGANGEVSGAWQFGVYFVALVMLWLINRYKKQHFSVNAMFYALAGSALAMIVMAVSPANAYRMEVMPPPANLGEFIYYTLRYSYDFVWDSIKTQPLPNLVFIMGSLALSLAVIPAAGLKLFTKNALKGILVVLVITFGLIVFSFSPSIFAGTNYPAPRALAAGRFTFLLGLMAAAFLAGFVVRDLFPRLTAGSWAAAIAAILILVSLYTVRTYRIPIAEGQDLAARADLWDKQDEQIKAAKLAGVMDVVIQQYDVVLSLNSLLEDPDYWVNKSAAAYYGVNSIAAKP